MKCPKCQSIHVAPILYGMPRGDAFEMAERGEVIFGGCECLEGQLDYGCLDCKFEWLKLDADKVEAQQTELELSGLNPDELERMNGEERRMVLVGAGLDLDVYDF